MTQFIKGRIYNCNFRNSIFRFHSHRKAGGIYYNEGYTEGIYYNEGYTNDRWVDKSERKDYISNLSYLHRATECTIEEANRLLQQWNVSYRFEGVNEGVEIEEKEVVYEIY